MRVEDNVWYHACFREGHVLGRPLLAANPLLAVTTGELVADDGVSLETRSPNKAGEVPSLLPTPAKPKKKKKGLTHIHSQFDGSSL